MSLSNAINIQNEVVVIISYWPFAIRCAFLFCFVKKQAGVSVQLYWIHKGSVFVQYFFKFQHLIGCHY